VIIGVQSKSNDLILPEKNINRSKKMSDAIGPRFMWETSKRSQEAPPQRRGIIQPPLELPIDETNLVALPKPTEVVVAPFDLRKAIEQRETIRNYSNSAISLEELSYLLWCTQGVKKVTERPVTLRTVPSAGARHAFETYLLVNRVDHLNPGLYRFAAIEHGLLAISHEADLAGRATQACGKQAHVLNSAVTFFWAATAERMTWRYMQRGYRYLHLDAGHVCQNLYLAAESLGCGVCAIAAYDDDAVNQILGLDGENQFAIYMASLGKKVLN
jgi:SagB-type dehydrogenase family enzyme